jgi:hypothetical protein
MVTDRDAGEAATDCAWPAKAAENPNELSPLRRVESPQSPINLERREHSRQIKHGPQQDQPVSRLEATRNIH